MCKGDSASDISVLDDNECGGGDVLVDNKSLADNDEVFDLIWIIHLVYSIAYFDVEGFFFY